MTQHTPANRRKEDAEEARIMAAISIVDLVCIGAIRAAVEKIKDAA